jgi:hypothetical protein
MTKKILHEITLIAFTVDGDSGLISICDIVETSKHCAPKFIRGFRRNDVPFIAAIAPGVPLSAANLKVLHR